MVGSKIITLREELGLSQKELAEKLNINGSVMNRIERGERPLKDDELMRIAEFFCVSVDYLLGKTSMRQYPLTPVSNTDLSLNETKLLTIFKMLDPQGQNKVIDYALDVNDSGKYTINSIKKETS